MCFSPEVSFAAAGVLTVIGIACVKNAKTKKEIPLATIPLFFALQQFIEGFVWIVDKPSPQATILAYGFLFFAYIIWPFWISYSYYLTEKSEKHKRYLIYLTAIGSGVAVGLLFLLILYTPSVTVVDHHLKYDIFTPQNKNIPLLTAITLLLYTIAACGAGFFTRYKSLRIFSSLSFIFLLIALIGYLSSWQSVWCFFAAILSLVIYIHFKIENKNTKA